MKVKLFLILFTALMSLNSCYTSHFTVGDGPIKDKGQQETFDKGRTLWLFWGLINVNEASPNTPSDGNYVIKRKTNFGDALITGLTAGIVSTKTTKIKIKKTKGAE